MRDRFADISPGIKFPLAQFWFDSNQRSPHHQPHKGAFDHKGFKTKTVSATEAVLLISNDSSLMIGGFIGLLARLVGTLIWIKVTVTISGPDTALRTNGRCKWYRRGPDHCFLPHSS
jgi:hypothetical protein